MLCHKNRVWVSGIRPLMLNSDGGHGSHPGAVWTTIVGVCADTHYSGLRDDPPPQFFLPYVQQPEVGGMTYEIRSNLGPQELTAEERDAMQETVARARD